MYRRAFNVVTGNTKKLEEFQEVMKGWDITTHDIDLPELQGDPTDIIKDKLKTAFKEIQNHCVVEDTSLCFNALKGLPGPYVKWFVEGIGAKGLYKMLDGFEDKTAYVQSYIGYVDKQKSMVFIGKTYGTIVSPRGDGQGFSSIFQPDGQTQTYAEMSKETRIGVSDRRKALQSLKQYLETKV